VPVRTDRAFADGPLPWSRAWALAATGRHGFWTDGPGSSGPAAHFRTSTHVGAAFAGALLVLLHQIDARLGHPPRLDVVDLGGGSGELLTSLLALADGDAGLAGRLRAVAVDVRTRPAGLDPRISWVRGLVPDAAPRSVTGLLLAHELLDEVPLDVVEVDADGRQRLVLVGADGHESWGGAPSDVRDLEWLERWWPAASPGERAEVGRPRDTLWARCVARLGSGTALAVDYGHTTGDRTSGRYADGTLTAYRDGRPTRPVPDGRVNLTAHVAVDSVAAAVGGSVTCQRDALRALGLCGALPASGLAAHDPAAYTDALVEACDAAELLDPSGLGAFAWVRVDR